MASAMPAAICRASSVRSTSGSMNPARGWGKALEQVVSIQVAHALVGEDDEARGGKQRTQLARDVAQKAGLDVDLIAVRRGDGDAQRRLIATRAGRRARDLVAIVAQELLDRLGGAARGCVPERAQLADVGDVAQR